VKKEFQLGRAIRTAVRPSQVSMRRTSAVTTLAQVFGPMQDLGVCKDTSVDLR
jgi:hypothetical protein